MTPIIFAFANLLLLLVTLLPMSRCEAWWVRGLDFPRLQFSSLAIMILLLECLLLDLTAPLSLAQVSITTACLLYQAWWILPYTPLYSVEVKTCQITPSDPQKAFKIMTANVLMSNRQADKLIATVRQNSPDILITLESDQWWQTQLDTLLDDYPHTIQCALDNLYGMHVYSRLELHDSQIKYLVESDIPSMHTWIQLNSGDLIYAHFLHPAPPSPVENDQSTERDAELLAVAKSIAERKSPVIVTGDLNDVAWSATTRLFRKISGLLDPRVGRGMFNTFHAQYFCIRWPLDHIFHSEHFRLTHLERLPIDGSDHFALLTGLTYLPQLTNGNPALHADDDDHAQAKEKMQQKGIKKDDIPG